MISFITRKASAISICLLLSPCFAQETLLHQCDLLAANPEDSKAVASGVDWDTLDADAAVAACAKAVKEYPETLRFGYQYGRAIHKSGDLEKAAEAYRVVAEKGYAQAQIALGHMYSRGEGVPQDQAVAIEWYENAAEQGHVIGQLILGNLYVWGEFFPTDYVKAAKWMRLAAEQSHAEGQFMLGNLYVTGNGVPQDVRQAADWMRKSADQGHAGAQYMLGIFYTNGEGVKKDEALAVQWYRRAAEQGFPDAQHELGRMYSAGRGIPQDDVQAYAWLSLAAARGHLPSRQVIGMFLAAMPTEKIAEAQDIAWQWEKIHASPLRLIDYEIKSGFVIVDQSHDAYTVFTGVPVGASSEERKDLAKKVEDEERSATLSWAEFVQGIHTIVNNTLVVHEYMEYGIVDAIVCLVGKTPGAPWGLTWNGGIALTMNDYRHTRDIYRRYRENQQKYILEIDREPRADPINPGGHLPAFGCM